MAVKGNEYLASEEANLLVQVQEICKFDAEDLQENKQGRLTPKQKTRLIWRALVPFAAMLATFAGLVLLAVWLYMFAPMITRRIRLMIYFGKYLTVFAGALFFGMVAFIVKFLLASGRIFNLLTDMSEGRVTHITGRLTTSQNAEIEDGLATITKTKTETYSFVVKGEYFEVPRDAWELMRERDGGVFRVYVTPHSRYLVAMETAMAESDVRDPFKLEYKPQQAW